MVTVINYGNSMSEKELNELLRELKREIRKDSLSMHPYRKSVFHIYARTFTVERVLEPDNAEQSQSILRRSASVDPKVWNSGEDFKN